MYGRRRYRRSRRRREAARRSLQKILFGVSFLCIVVVCAVVALETRRAAREVEAETAPVRTATVTVRTEPVKEAGGEKDTKTLRQGKAEDEGEKTSVIMIDPGHGGMDGGCAVGDILEKDINRMIADSVIARLKHMGYQAELVREGDDFIDKTERVEKANARNAQLYVSIHQNSCEDDSAAGIETWYDDSDPGRDSGRLARLVQQEAVRETGAVSRELVSGSELCVTSKTTMPSCLIETGFLTNREERSKLATAEYREQLAEGIARGIDRYLKPGR